jgi:integrase
MAGSHDVDKNWKGKKLKGSILQRGPDSWRLTIDAGRDLRGNRKRVSVTVRGTREDALRRLASLNEELEDARVIVTSGMRVKKYLEHWLETDARMGVNKKTYERYREITRNHLIPAFGHLRLSQLEASHVQLYIKDALDHGRLDGRGGLSEQTVVHHVRVLHRAMEDAVNNRQLPFNPVTSVKKPKVKKRQIQPYEPNEMQRILSKARGRRIYAPILVDYSTGLRRGEVLGLRWKDVDLESGNLRIMQALKQTEEGLEFGPPKSGVGRSVAISPTIVEALKKHRTEQSKQKLLLGEDYRDIGLVFCLEDGEMWPPDSFTTNFKSLRESLGLGGTFHDIRHTHATELLKMGVHPKIVSERLGHSTTQVTLDLYSHVLPDMQRAVAMQLDEALIAIQEDVGFRDGI